MKQVLLATFLCPTQGKYGSRDDDKNQMHDSFNGAASRHMFPPSVDVKHQTVPRKVWIDSNECPVHGSTNNSFGLQAISAHALFDVQAIRSFCRPGLLT